MGNQHDNTSYSRNCGKRLLKTSKRKQVKDEKQVVKTEGNFICETCKKTYKTNEYEGHTISEEHRFTEKVQPEKIRRK